jgi:hypothetical protein
MMAMMVVAMMAVVMVTEETPSGPASFRLRSAHQAPCQDQQQDCEQFIHGDMVVVLQGRFDVNFVGGTQGFSCYCPRFCEWCACLLKPVLSAVTR